MTDWVTTYRLTPDNTLQMSGTISQQLQGVVKNIKIFMGKCEQLKHVLVLIMSL